MTDLDLRSDTNMRIHVRRNGKRVYCCHCRDDITDKLNTFMTSAGGEFCNARCFDDLVKEEIEKEEEEAW